MFTQTKVSQSPAEPESAPVTDGVVNLASDLFLLAELQASLLRLDWNESRLRLLWSILGIVICSAIIIGSLPVLVAGISFLLAQVIDWPAPLITILICAPLMIVSAAGLILSLSGIASALRRFDRSQSEFNSNLKWIRTAIEQSWPSCK